MVAASPDGHWTHPSVKKPHKNLFCAFYDSIPLSNTPTFSRDNSGPGFASRAILVILGLDAQRPCQNTADDRITRLRYAAGKFTHLSSRVSKLN